MVAEQIVALSAKLVQLAYKDKNAFGGRLQTLALGLPVVQWLGCFPEYHGIYFFHHFLLALFLLDSLFITLFESPLCGGYYFVSHGFL